MTLKAKMIVVRVGFSCSCACTVGISSKFYLDVLTLIFLLPISGSLGIF